MVLYIIKVLFVYVRYSPSYSSFFFRHQHEPSTIIRYIASTTIQSQTGAPHLWQNNNRIHSIKTQPVDDCLHNRFYNDSNKQEGN